MHSLVRIKALLNLMSHLLGYSTKAGRFEATACCSLKRFLWPFTTMYLTNA